jgi:cytidine deaminase
MIKREITIKYCEYTAHELSEKQSNLINQSVKAQENSHSPYSNFRVGAAILLESGEIILGSNQENAAYPSGLCAERVAIFSCGAQHPKKKILAIAISASTSKFDLKEILAPCGACRQSMLEFEYKQKSNIKILLKGADRQVVEFASVKDLLPIPFNCDALQNVS